jgi:hypothetical protein
MKLYATLETSTGKVVDVSDNEQIVATVYDGNKKAYSVIIEWCVVGDAARIKCNHCEWQGDEEDVDIKDEIESCPQCKKSDALMDVPAIMGAVVTTREWRNQPDARRYKGINKCEHKQTTKTVHGKYCLYCHAYL